MTICYDRYSSIMPILHFLRHKLVKKEFNGLSIANFFVHLQRYIDNEYQNHSITN